MKTTPKKQKSAVAKKTESRKTVLPGFNIERKLPSGTMRMTVGEISIEVSQ